MEVRPAVHAPHPIGAYAASSAARPPEPADRVSLDGRTAEEEPLRPLRILHMNDVHGAVEEALPRAATVIDRQRNDTTLTLNAGDLAEGSMVAYLTRGQVVAQALGRMGFDAIEPGNHDFAWGQEPLEAMLSDTGAPVVGANIVRDDGSPWAAPYLLKDVGGVKVGIVGVDTPDMKRFVSAEKLQGLDFQDPVATVARYLPEVRAAGAEVVVVLSHLGFEEDRKLARAVPGLDVIVGGHSHTELPHGHREGETLIVQAGSAAKHVGQVDLEFDPTTRRIVSSQAQLLAVTPDVPPDPEVQAVVNRALAEIAPQSGRVMGIALEDLPHSHKEAAMINQIHADSLLAGTGAEIAICSVRNPRGDVKQGEVTYGQLFAAFPMTEEDAVVLRATGATILAELEERISDTGRGCAVPAGFRYSYDPARPSGSRLTGVTLADGTPLDPGREYVMATTSTTARKKTFARATELRNAGSSQEMFMEYFRAGSPWRNAPDDRVAHP